MLLLHVLVLECDYAQWRLSLSSNPRMEITYHASDVLGSVSEQGPSDERPRRANVAGIRVEEN